MVDDSGSNRTEVGSSRRDPSKASKIEIASEPATLRCQPRDLRQRGERRTSQGGGATTEGEVAAELSVKVPRFVVVVPPAQCPWDGRL